jgi:arylsulfatase A-like enzyme
MRKFLLALLLATASVCLGIYAVSIRGHQSPFHLPEKPNVILVTIDTLRADHLGCYGYPRNTSPFIDDMARNGVLFEKAISSSSATTPSLASIFTSLEVDQHGVYNNFFDHFPDHYSSLYTMAHMFSDQGYRTIGISAVGFLRYIDGGFSEFMMGDRPTGRRPGRDAGDPAGGYHFAPADRQYDVLAKDVLAKIAADERFFIWLHFYDIHEYDTHHRVHDTQLNYEELFDISSDEGRQQHTDALRTTSDKTFERQYHLDVINVYDEKIRFVDRTLRRIYDHLQEKRLNDETLWIITSDHGEGLWQHKIRGHAEELYNAQLYVPLIFHSQNMDGDGSRIEQLVRNVDILPTLAELIGGSLEKQTMEVQGTSLLPLVDGDKTALADYAYSRLPMYHRNWVEKGTATGMGYAIQNLDYKYIFHTHQDDEFYDLGKDPHESHNLIDAGLPMKDTLEREAQALYGQYIADYQAHLEEDEATTIDDETLEELRALGYVQ